MPQTAALIHVHVKYEEPPRVDSPWIEEELHKTVIAPRWGLVINRISTTRALPWALRLRTFGAEDNAQIAQAFSLAGRRRHTCASADSGLGRLRCGDDDRTAETAKAWSSRLRQA